MFYGNIVTSALLSFGRGYARSQIDFAESVYVSSDLTISVEAISGNKSKVIVTAKSGSQFGKAAIKMLFSYCMSISGD